MLIYMNDEKYERAALFLEKVPAVLKFEISDSEYLFSLDGENVGELCPYEKEIKAWIDRNFDALKEIVWKWNIGEENTIELIQDEIKRN